jgi:hypothetical protein
MQSHSLATSEAALPEPKSVSHDRNVAHMEERLSRGMG